MMSTRLGQKATLPSGSVTSTTLAAIIDQEGVQNRQTIGQLAID